MAGRLSKSYSTRLVHKSCPYSLLLHAETAEGSVIPVWEQVYPDNVKVVKDIMASREFIQSVELYHRRIPITSELPPDFSDFAEYVVHFPNQHPLFIHYSFTKVARCCHSCWYGKTNRDKLSTGKREKYSSFGGFLSPLSGNRSFRCARSYCACFNDGFKQAIRNHILPRHHEQNFYPFQYRQVILKKYKNHQ